MTHAIELLEEMERLLRLNDENPFKVRAFEKARKALQGREDLLERAKLGTLTEIPGIGKGIEQVLSDFLLHGKTTQRDELAAKLPQGLLELTELPGLGPKKAKTIIEELGVQSIGELEYACRENRLIGLKGFGDKAQAQILKAIQERKSYQGRALWSDLRPWVEGAWAELRKVSALVEPVGEYRRKLEVVSKVEFAVAPRASEKKARSALESFIKKNPTSVQTELHFSEENEFGTLLFRSTSTKEHTFALKANASLPSVAFEEELYKKYFHIEWIAPELRETGEEVAYAREGKLADLPDDRSIRGVFHNHTTRSDGAATLEEMVREAERLGFEYIGISDHSQSAFYANGLKEDDLKAQKDEIERVQEKFPKVRIFFGVESDILQDGSLDYPDKVLKRLDFVVASIHSRFKMDREAMTARILRAIDHPATRFIGHLTGRLLLGRSGYELDFERIFERAAQKNVAIEINSHPARMDVDWRWGRLLRQCGTLVSIHPDAHEVAGVEDFRNGVVIARKALLTRQSVVNTQNVDSVARWLSRG